MTSSPLRQFVLALLGAVCIGLALHHATSGEKAVSITPPAYTAAPGSATPAVMTVRCAHQPESLSISCGTNVIWSATRPALLTEAECSLPLQNGSATLTVTARWPANTPDTPVTLELEPEGKQAETVTRWSFGNTLTDTYSFSWK